MGVVSTYLGYVTSAYHLFRTPIGLISLIVIVPALVGATIGALGSHRSFRRPNAPWLPGLLVVLAAGAILAVAILRLLAIHFVRHLATIAIRDGPAVLLEVANRRVYGLPAWTLSAVFATALVAAGLAGFSRRVRPGPVAALALVALVTMVLGDAVLFQSPGLRDLRLYLLAGANLATGSPIYIAGPLVVLPSDPELLPFLYPPLTLPAFEFLSSIAFPIIAGAWVAASIGCAIAALRLFGVRWRWTMILLLWPAFAQGLYVGNVAVPALLLFALGARAGGTLILAGVFKLQDALPALWLLRSRRRRAFALGLAVVGFGVLWTVPLTGIDRWQQWISALLAFKASQSAFPGLYGLALPGFLPYPAYVAVAVGAVVAAVAAGRSVGLRRLGVAAVASSPSLYPHGFGVALPAFLDLEPFWLWIVLALTSTVLGGGWWAAIVIVVASWLVPGMRRATPVDSADVGPTSALDPVRLDARALGSK